MVGRVALALCAAALACITACSAAPRCSLAATQVAGPPWLWRVQRPGGPTVWLFGTLHDSGSADVAPAAWGALNQAPVFVSELGGEAPDPRKLADLARQPWGEVLDRQLAADDWWDLVTAMQGAMREEELRRARPWFVVMRLISHLARSPRPSMDDALASAAHERGLRLEALESWEAQLSALASTVTPADLTRTIRARAAVACEMEALRVAYRGGDEATLRRVLLQQGALLDGRTRAWLPRIERLLADRGAFVAVGLGHLLGDRGLPALLAQAGYVVERAR